jgi:hypothetical protein
MLILGISANFVLDFVHVALKGIIINAEVSSLKISFSLEASLLLLAPTFVLLPSFRVTRASLTHAYDKVVFLISPKSSKDYTLHRRRVLVSGVFLFTLLILLCFYCPDDTFLSGDGLTPGLDCTAASYLATEALPPSLSGFFFVRLVSRHLPPTAQVNPCSPQDVPRSEAFYTLIIGAYLVFYTLSLLLLTTD